jgi:alpha-L-rhamnosidase
MQYFSKKCLSLCFFLMLTSLSYAQFKVVSLKTDYQQTPLGTDAENHFFSWQMETGANLKGQSQKAYQITVIDEAGKTVWDSKKIENGTSVGIRYNGETLSPVTRYVWKVTVWNQDGKKENAASWFETGLMDPNPNLSAWDGAHWIGGNDNDLVFYSHYLTVFKLSYEIQLDRQSKSTKAAFIFGANDERLMDRNMNTKGVSSKKDASYIKTELDISNVNGTATGTAKLTIYRVGYAEDDRTDSPFKVLSIPLSLINQSNKYDKHHVFISSIFGVSDFYIDGNDEAHRISIDDRGKPASINLNPEGWGADYIAYPAVADIGFAVEKGQKAFFSKVRIMNNRAPSNVMFQEELTAKKYEGIFAKSGTKTLQITNGHYIIDGRLQPVHIIANPTQNASPMLRTEFKTTGKKIKKARLYATARGIYELYLNGDRIGNEYFNPGLTQYDKTQLYQTYDVTQVVVENGGNALGALLSEGWWSGNITFTGNHWNFFGDRQSLLAKLVITYNDGTTQVVTTNPDTWKYYNDGPIRYGSFFQGEVYDATKEKAVAGWDKPGFNDSRWTKTQVIGTEITTYNETTNAQNEQVRLDFTKMKLVGMPGVKAIVVQKIKPLSVKEVRPGVFVYDMGKIWWDFLK